MGTSHSSKQLLELPGNGGESMDIPSSNVRAEWNAPPEPVAIESVPK